jgi:hypothetical protein
VAPNSGERIKKAREKKSGTMKGSIPRSEFEAEMEKDSEGWNPKKYARRTDLGGRWKWRRELMVSAAGGLFLFSCCNVKDENVC